MTLKPTETKRIHNA